MSYKSEKMQKVLSIATLPSKSISLLVDKEWDISHDTSALFSFSYNEIPTTTRQKIFQIQNMVLIENRKHAMFFVFILGHFLDTNSFHACHILIFPLIVQFFISMVFQKVGIFKVKKLSTYRICKKW